MITPFQTISICNLSPTQLPFIMALNAPYSLPQRITTAMLMIRMGHLMFMKYNAEFRQRIFRIMYIPHMPCIPRYDGHIRGIHVNNLKIPRIQTFQIFLLNTCYLLSKIPLKCLLYNLLHCSGINLCKILLIYLHLLDQLYLYIQNKTDPQPPPLPTFPYPLSS